MIVADETLDHEYLPIDGLKAFTEASAKVLLGANSPVLLEHRFAAVQSLSGTGALRIGAEMLHRIIPKSQVYIPNPTWIVHRNLFGDAGFQVFEYPYWHQSSHGLDFDGWMRSIEEAPKHSIFVVHACAHNPTGVDPTKDQWLLLADAFLQKQHFVFMDIAYQGFASGNLDEDAYSTRLFAAKGLEMFIAQSYSKNLGLYNERVGCLVVISKTSQQAANLKSQLVKIIRNMYSNPPAFGARIALRILTCPELFSEWHDAADYRNSNLKVMVDRIKGTRKLLFEELKRLKTPGSWTHILTQIGMFSYTGLSAPQSRMMKEKFHIYLTDNGRISMAGLNAKNIPYFAESMDYVVRHCH